MINPPPKKYTFLSKNKIYLLQIIILFFIFVIVMPPDSWHSNEENYLGMAWMRFKPQSLVQISALNDPVNHRFLFDYLTGACINLIGFDWTHALGRILVSLLYAVSLTILFKNLKFTLLNSLTIILIFVWIGEDILGGEWLFRGFESKTLAYPFVFLSFSSSLNKKFKISYLLLVIATYFHFLVGLSWFLFTCTFEYYWQKRIKKILIESIPYIVACTPLFIMIAIQQFSDLNSGNSELSPSWIYSYFRNPHHVAPFASSEIFRKNWYEGIVFLLGLTIISFIIYNCSEKKEKNIAKLILLSNFYLIAILIISGFDKNGSLGKFYLFRPSSIILFLLLCFYGVFLQQRLSKNFNQFSWIALIFIGSLSIPTFAGHDFIYNRVQPVVIQKAPLHSLLLIVNDFLPSINYQEDKSNFGKIIMQSQKSDIFLIEPKLEPKYLNFERKYNRPTLVFRKFVPTKNDSILRWFKLLKAKEKLFTEGCPSLIVQEYNISYLIGDIDNNKIKSCGKIVYNDESVQIIAVSKDR